jgi:streptogramin lyase
MRDLDRLLRDSLKSVGDAFAPSDPVAARQRYVERRRRRLFTMSFGSAAAAATAIALIVYLTPASDPDVRTPALDVTSRFLTVTESIPVGDAPSGIDIGEAGVWVANSGDGTVMRINQTFNEVAETVDVGGEPDDVAVGEDALWVADPNRSVVTKVEISEAGGAAEQTEIEVPLPQQHLDIAFGGDAVWVVAATEGILYRIDADTDAIDRWDGARLASDVSVDGDGVPWTLGRHQGRRIITPSAEANVTSSRVITDASGDLGKTRANADLAAGAEHLWVSLNTGRVLMLDPGGPVVAQHDVGGSYTGISVYRGLVWAVTGSGDDQGSGMLTRFEDGTGDRVGAPLPLTGRPFDVAVGRTGIWVTHNSSDSVSRLRATSD